MITSSEKLSAHLAMHDMSIVRASYISRCRLESGRISDTRIWMVEHGFEVIDVPDGCLLSDDGREILHAHGKAWALRPEIHATRLTEALDQARQRDAAIAAQSTQPLTQLAICTAVIDGNLCGGDLTLTPICPRCALGKQGVAQIMTCDVCGTQTAVMR